MSLFSFFKNSRANERQTRQTTRLTVESLEERQLMACNAMTEICGTANQDYVKIDATSISIWRNVQWNGNVPIGPASQSMPVTGGGTVTIRLEGDFDKVDILNGNPLRKIVIDGGAWSDSINALTSGSNTWKIDGENAGSINLMGRRLLQTGYRFVGFSDLGGSHAGDKFCFVPGGLVTGSIDTQEHPNATLDYSAYTTPVMVDLAFRTATGFRFPWRLDEGFRKVVGGSGNDILRGSFVDEELRGGGGNDVLVGYNGNDKLYGDAGNDILIGGHGADYLEGGANSDLLHGGVWGDGYAPSDLSEFATVWGSNQSYGERWSKLANGFVGTNGQGYVFWPLTLEWFPSQPYQDLEADSFRNDASAAEDCWIMDHSYIFGRSTWDYVV